MKAIPVVLAVAVVVLTTAGVQPSHAQFGVAIGLNFDSITDIDTGSREATFDNATGFHVGVFYDLAAGPLAIRPGLFYRQVPGVDVDISGDGGILTESFDMSLIEVPIDLRFRFAMPFVRPYALAGPVFGFASTSDDDFSDALQDLTVAANIGLGVEVSLPGFSPTLYPEIRYSFGISRFLSEEYTIGGTTVTAEDAQRLNTFMLRLGITF